MVGTNEIAAGAGKSRAKTGCNGEVSTRPTPLSFFSLMFLYPVSYEEGAWNRLSTSQRCLKCIPAVSTDDLVAEEVMLLSVVSEDAAAAAAAAAAAFLASWFFFLFSSILTNLKMPIDRA